MRDDSNLKDTMELFKEKRRQQDNDLFYYLNTIVEVNSILFELSNSLEDASSRLDILSDEMKKFVGE